MRYKNVHADSALNFDLKGRKVTVPVGGVITIPDDCAYMVEQTGLSANLKPLAEVGQDVVQPDSKGGKKAAN